MPVQTSRRTAALVTQVEVRLGCVDDVVRAILIAVGVLVVLGLAVVGFLMWRFKIPPRGLVAMLGALVLPGPPGRPRPRGRSSDRSASSTTPDVVAGCRDRGLPAGQRPGRSLVEGGVVKPALRPVTGPSKRREGHPVIELVREMTYRLEVSGPIEDAGPSADGAVQYWEMTSATLEGPRIKATSPLRGNDWFRPLGDGYGRPQVRPPFRTDDGAVILLEYRGLVQATDAFTAAVENDGSTEWDDQYMRMAMWFDTANPAYGWLVHLLFLARGRLLNAQDDRVRRLPRRVTR